MSGTYQHYIPRLVQDGFVSRAHKDWAQRYTWLFHRQHGVSQPNLKGSCAERYFYGDATDPILDNEITSYEGEVLAPLWKMLRTAPTGQISHPGIPKMLVHFELRTKNFREMMLDPLEYFRDALIGQASNIDPVADYWSKVIVQQPWRFFPGNSYRVRALREMVKRTPASALGRLLAPILQKELMQLSKGMTPQGIKDLLLAPTEN